MYVGPTRGTLGDLPPRATESNDRAQLGFIPGGAAGTKATLKIMKDLARASVRHPEQRIRAKARELISDLPPRAYAQEVKALHAFVKDQIRYTRDPVSVELVQTPEKTLEYAQGDCDDKATLLAALLDSIGHPSQFVAVGFPNGPDFSHVLVETRVGNRWVPLETIIDRPPGWFPSGVARAYRMSV